MKILLLAVAMASSFPWVAYAAEACSRDVVSVATTPAPPQREAFLEKISQTNRILAEMPQVVVIGDSLAAMWPRKLLAQYFPGRKVANIGVMWDTTNNALWQLQQVNRTYSIETAVVIIGTNNIRRRDAPCAVAAGISKVITEVEKKLQPKNLVYIQIPPMKKRNGAFETLREASLSDLRGIAPSNVTMVNVDDALRCGSEESQCAYYRPDGLHLLPQGYLNVEKSISASISGSR